MRIFKLAFISVFLLLLVVTIMSLFIPSQVKISRAININTVADSVWVRVEDTGTWPEWNSLPVNKIVHWTRRDNAEHAVRIPTSRGSSFISGWRCVEHGGIDSVTVQWWLDFRLKWYPWEKFRSLLFEKTYGPHLEEGLARLKTLLEN